MHLALELRDVTVRYPGTPAPALAGVTLSVGAGECVGVVCAEAGGGTSLLHCAAGLVGPDAGAVRWFGTHRWQAARAAYAPPRAHAHPYLSVRAWLEFNAAQLSDAAMAVDPDVTLVLARAALSEFSRIRVGHLTAGVSARVAIAAALLSSPRLLALDCPFDGLSGAECDRLASVVDRFRADGVTLVVTARTDAALAALRPDVIDRLAGGRLAAPREEAATLELDVPLPLEARSRLANRMPTVYRRGRALRVPLRACTAEQVLAECRSLGIEVRASRLVEPDAPSRRRVAERPPRAASGSAGG